MSTNLFEFSMAVFAAGALLTTGALLMYGVLERIGKIAKPALPQIYIVDSLNSRVRSIVLPDNDGTVFDPVVPEEAQQSGQDGQDRKRRDITL
jgi:hypothetical protein